MNKHIQDKGSCQRALMSPFMFPKELSETEQFVLKKKKKSHHPHLNLQLFVESGFGVNEDNDFHTQHTCTMSADCRRGDGRSMPTVAVVSPN